MKPFFRLVTVALLTLGLIACSQEEATQANIEPFEFRHGDECIICGMLILEWPGPKGQSINKHSGEKLKFCSTTDLFSWWLQPENRTLQAQIYVHDMTESGWNKPDDGHLIDAREAWYVVGSDMIGAMGPTLVSFGTEAAAQQLIDEHGGRIVRFDDIDMHLLAEISAAGHEFAATHAQQLRAERGLDDDDYDEDRKQPADED